MRTLFAAAALALLPTLASAADLAVSVGITPAQSHTYTVTVDGPEVSKTFTSAVPLKATMKATTTSNGHIELVVSVETTSTKLTNQVKGQDRKAVSELIGNGGVLANPTITMPPGKTGEFNVAAQSKGGTVGLKISAKPAS